MFEQHTTYSFLEPKSNENPNKPSNFNEAVFDLFQQTQLDNLVNQFNCLIHNFLLNSCVGSNIPTSSYSVGAVSCYSGWLQLDVLMYAKRRKSAC